MISSNLGSITVLFVAFLSSHQTRSFKVDADGLLSLTNSKMLISKKSRTLPLEWSGLKSDAATVTPILATFSMTDLVIKQEYDIA